MGNIEHPERDDAAVKVAEALWPNRHAGDLTTDDWKRCYGVVDAANDQLAGAVEAERARIIAWLRTEPSSYIGPKFCGEIANLLEAGTQSAHESEGSQA